MRRHYLRRTNFHVAEREHNGKVQYLHKVEAGRAEKSFGIYVAQIAGLPKPVLRRANELLNDHDNSNSREAKGNKQKPGAPEHRTSEHRASEHRASEYKALLEGLLSLDINELSPVEALTKLYDLQRRAKDLQSSDA
jgi:DNA mismatch repair protein MutS